MNVQPCTDLSDLVVVSEQLGLHLKPIAALTITIQLPQQKAACESVSNWEVMEKLRVLIAPDEFVVLKVTKATVEFLRFEAELPRRDILKPVIQRLDSKQLNVAGVGEPLKIKAAEAKLTFPSRSDWDSYFRDAKNMNEMKPGERPDTIRLESAPTRWFMARDPEHLPPPGAKIQPNGYVVKQFFETWGDIRVVDIPSNDPFRTKMSPTISGIQNYTPTSDQLFDAFVQFKEYIGFVKAMTALRGMKLVFTDAEGKSSMATIGVDFDRTRHLSDASIRNRRAERERLIAAEREREERVRKEKELEMMRVQEGNRKVEEAALEKKRLRMEKRQEKIDRRKKKAELKMQQQLLRVKLTEERALSVRIAVEERKLLIAQRKLGGLRLVDFLLYRVTKTMEEKEKASGFIPEVTKDDAMKKELERQERFLRHRLISTFKERQEQHADEQKEKLRAALEEKENQLKHLLETSAAFAGPVDDDMLTASLSEISSDSSSLSEAENENIQEPKNDSDEQRKKLLQIASSSVPIPVIEADGVISAPPPPMPRAPFWGGDQFGPGVGVRPGGRGGMWRGNVRGHWGFNQPMPRYPQQQAQRANYINPRLRKKFIDLDYEKRKEVKRMMKGKDHSGSSSSSSDSEDEMRPMRQVPPTPPFGPYGHMGPVPMGYYPSPQFYGAHQPQHRGRGGYNRSGRGRGRNKQHDGGGQGNQNNRVNNFPSVPPNYPRHHFNPAIAMQQQQKQKFTGRNTFTGSTTEESEEETYHGRKRGKKRKRSRSRSRSRSSSSYSRSRSRTRSRSKSSDSSRSRSVGPKKGKKIRRARSFSSESDKVEKKRKKKRRDVAGNKKDRKKKKEKKKKKKGLAGNTSGRKVTLVKRDYDDEEKAEFSC